MAIQSCITRACRSLVWEKWGTKIEKNKRFVLKKEKSVVAITPHPPSSQSWMMPGHCFVQLELVTVTLIYRREELGKASERENNQLHSHWVMPNPNTVRKR